MWGVSERAIMGIFGLHCDRRSSNSTECADVMMLADMCFYHFCCRTILWRLFIGQDFCTSEGHHISWAKGLRVRATYIHITQTSTRFKLQFLFVKIMRLLREYERKSQSGRFSLFSRQKFKYSSSHINILLSLDPENSSNKRGI